MLKFLNGNVILFLIIVFGSFLRLYNLNFDNLWYDEILSFWVASPQHSLIESFKIHNRTEPNTFLFHFLLKIFYEFFGYNLDYTRYLSVFFGILSIFLTLKIAKLLNFYQMKNFFAFLIALNIYLISYSQEGRVYSILFFFSFLSLIYFIKIFSKKEKRKDNYLFIIFTCISIFLHPFALIILFSYCTFLILKYLATKKNSKQINNSLILIFIFSFLFYFFYFISLDHTHSRHYWITNPDLSFYTNFFFSSFFGSRLMGGIFLLSLLILIIKEKKLIKNIHILTVLLITIILAYLLPLIFGYVFKPVLISRYIIFVLIPILTIISLLSSRISTKKIKYSFVFFLISMTFLNHFTEQTFKQFLNERVPSKPEYNKAISYINKSEHHYYFIKVENMLSDLDSINAINNYISILSQKLPNKLILINSEEKETIKKPYWHFCPQDINKKVCSPDIKKNYDIVIEKNFNNINLKLINLL